MRKTGFSKLKSDIQPKGTEKLPNILLVLKFASYSFSLSFKFARFNFVHLVRLIRASNFPCSFCLVCLIELLTINAFIMSIFYQQILPYLSKLNQKAIKLPSKNAFRQNYVNYAM